MTVIDFPGLLTVESESLLGSRWANPWERFAHGIDDWLLVLFRLDGGALNIAQQWHARQYLLQHPDLPLAVVEDGEWHILPRDWAPQRTRDGVCPRCKSDHDLRVCSSSLT